MHCMIIDSICLATTQKDGENMQPKKHSSLPAPVSSPLVVYVPSSPSFRASSQPLLLGKTWDLEL